MTKEVLALDLDSTLANIHPVAFELLEGPENDYSVEQVTDWEWGVREFGEAAYLSALWNVWTLRPDEVQPYEDDIAETVSQLREDFEVHIVTAHPDHMGISEGKQNWVDEQGIPYDRFRPVCMGVSKSQLDYHVLVDDKPTVPEEADRFQRVYMFDQPYNAHAEGDYIRVESVNEVLRRETVSIPTPRKI